MTKLLVIIALVFLLPLTALAQEPGVQELQQEEYFKEFSTEVYDQIEERLETEKERRSKSDEKETPQTKEDILETYGEPFHKDEGVWYYPRPFRMFVFFDEEGRVTRIDFSTGEKL